MNDNPSNDERRNESRRSSIAERICWTSFDQPEAHAGWLSDISPNSFAFVTPMRDQPQPGDRIEITLGVATEMPKHRSVRVVRTERYDRYFSMVACQAEPPA